jgi:hypothetical protein
MSKYNMDIDYLIIDRDITREELQEIITTADEIIADKNTDDARCAEAYLKKA